MLIIDLDESLSGCLDYSQPGFKTQLVAAVIARPGEGVRLRLSQAVFGQI